MKTTEKIGLQGDLISYFRENRLSEETGNLVGSLLRKRGQANRRIFQVNEALGQVLTGRRTLHEDLKEDSRVRLIGIMFWTNREFTKHVIMLNKVGEEAERVLNGLFSEQRRLRKEEKVRGKKQKLIEEIREFGFDLNEKKNDLENSIEVENEVKDIKQLVQEYINLGKKAINGYDKMMEESDNLIKMEETFMKKMIGQLMKIRKKMENEKFSADSKELGFLMGDILMKVVHCVDWVYELNKLLYFLVMSGKNILFEGYCVKKEDEDPNEREEEEMMDEGGEGMGEGRGDQGVENEMEYEEQLMGLKDELEEMGEDTEEKEEEEEKEDQEKEENKEFEKEEDNRNEGDDQNKEGGNQKKEGLEVGNDFGGENAEGEKEQQDDNMRMGSVDEEEVDPKLFEDSADEEGEEDQNEQNQISKFEFEKEDLDKEGGEQEAKEEDEEKEVRDGEEVEEVGLEGNDEDEQGGLEEEIEEEMEEEDDQMDFENEENENVEAIQEEELEEFDLENLEDVQVEEEGSLEEEVEDPKIEEEVPEENNEMEEGKNDQEEEVEEQKETENQNKINLEVRNEDEVNAENYQGGGAKEVGEEEGGTGGKGEIEENQNEKQSASEKLKDILKKFNIDKNKIDEIVKEPELNEEEGEQKEEAGEAFQQVGEDEDEMKGARIKEKDLQKRGEEKENEEEKNEGDAEQEQEPEERLEEEENWEREQEEKMIKLDKRSSEEFQGKDQVDEESLKVENELKRVNENRLDEYEQNVEKYQQSLQKVEADTEKYNILRHKGNQMGELFEELLEKKRTTEYKGDYRSGKKLSMRRIIGYIASDYRRDKIWLRKAEPEERNFRVTIAIDNSLSMAADKVGELALESGLITIMGLLRARVEKVILGRINHKFEVVQMFQGGQVLESRDVAKLRGQFCFSYSDIDSSNLAMPNSLREIREKMGIEASGYSSKRREVDRGNEYSDGELQDVVVIMSDGKLNKGLTRVELAKFYDSNVKFVFIVLDSQKSGDSIINYRTTRFELENGKRVVKVTNYLDDFPFKFYVVVNDVASLTQSLIDVMTQSIFN